MGLVLGYVSQLGVLFVENMRKSGYVWHDNMCHQHVEQDAPSVCQVYKGNDKSLFVITGGGVSEGAQHQCQRAQRAAVHGAGVRSCSGHGHGPLGLRLPL